MAKEVNQTTGSTALDSMGSFATIDYVTRQDTSFARTEGGFVSMKRGDKWYPRVLFYRAFPYTYRDEFISVRDIDMNELGMIRALIDFSKEEQEMILDQIELRYFSPRITSIRQAKEEFGYVYWDVTTTAGPCRFTSRNGHGSIVHITQNQVVVIDVDGNRFEIEDLTKLDPKDVKKLELFL
nr:DUF1854 domain-containing protein [bacterium]